jgi:peptide/nickel transport system ATP-binding protein
MLPVVRPADGLEFPLMTDSPAPQPAIELARVTKKYPGTRRGISGPAAAITALEEVDLAVAPGEIFGLVGESGSGKTTVGRLVVGLERPDSGTVRVDGRDIRRLRGAGLKAFRQQVQMIFQDPYQSLNPYMSVKEAVAEPLVIKGGLTLAQRLLKVAQTLRTAGLTPVENYLYSYPHQLSGGQRQRVAIARAMVLEPQIIVADEPTSMLDASMSIQIFHVLAEIQQKRNVTLVLITHSLAAAHYLCDRIAVIYRGHVMETGPASTVIRHPRHPYTRALLDALPEYGHPWSGRRYDALLSPERAANGDQGCAFYCRCNFARDERCSRRRPNLEPVDDVSQAACWAVACGDLPD